MVEPQDMFDDMVQRVPEIADVVRQLGRPLRVATMCSGTEAPLLALDMISNALEKQHDGLRFEVEHLFSCEIEPWKQAYIERNFSPPILFRDIRELGADEATTCYGAKVPVPGGVDLLVAGTSCTDNSALNPSRTKKTNFGKEMKEVMAMKKAKELKVKGAHELANSKMGESGQTFFGMLAWVARHKPPIIILENVSKALWELMRQMLILEGYHAEFMRLDTKAYYIPHTRTRIYMCAVLKGNNTVPSNVVTRWSEQVKAMQSPAPHALESFLFAADDPRVTRLRARMDADLEQKTRSRNEWEKCAHRHKHERESHMVGPGRPVTIWEEDGTCQMPDFAWQQWAKLQPDRVLDSIDILYLRLVRDYGFDPAHKTILWNISQVHHTPHTQDRKSTRLNSSHT